MPRSRLRRRTASTPSPVVNGSLQKADLSKKAVKALKGNVACAASRAQRAPQVQPARQAAGCRRSGRTLRARTGTRAPPATRGQRRRSPVDRPGRHRRALGKSFVTEPSPLAASTTVATMRCVATRLSVPSSRRHPFDRRRIPSQREMRPAPSQRAVTRDRVERQHGLASAASVAGGVGHAGRPRSLCQRLGSITVRPTALVGGGTDDGRLDEDRCDQRQARFRMRRLYQLSQRLTALEAARELQGRAAQSAGLNLAAAVSRWSRGRVTRR